jgi:putative exporter of polyketide antibiotics
VGLLLCSVVLNFVEPFIEFIKHIRFLGLLNYFRPVDVVRTGQWPISSMLVLVGLAAICWTIGLITFSRRDIPTA